jgi:hypothetical protein
MLNHKSRSEFSPQEKIDFPLKLKGKELVTSTGKPFLINGDTPWSLVVGPDSAGVELYLENRKNKGVNALLVNLIEHYFNGPEDAYGHSPFLIPGDFSTPNPAYFDYADFVIRRAEENGMEVFLFPAYLGAAVGDGTHKEGWFNEVVENGPAKMYVYGKYVGQRYKKFRNIIWMMGGDCAPAEAIDEIRAMVKGIEDSAGPQIFSVHNARYHSGVTEYPGETWLTLNTTYAECTKTPSLLLSDYKRDMPFFFVEGRYENEKASAVCIRSQLYWTVLMGSLGSFFATSPVWNFGKDWQNYLDTQGAGDLERAGNFFRSVSWFNLVPDIGHNVLTSGYGNLTDGSYAAAAKSKDSRTLIVYSPDKRILTLNLSELSGKNSNCRWINPSDGKSYYVGLITNKGSRTFTPPGDGDWLLVLDDKKPNLSSTGSQKSNK